MSAIRQNIIETASRLFYEKGYNLTGINEIIAEAGIAKATLYSHFKSKDDLCVAYLQFKNETFLKDVRAYMLKAQEGENQILALFDFLKKFFKNKDFNGCWCINTVSEIPREKIRIKQEIQNQKNNFISLLEDFMIQNFPNKTKAENKKMAKKIYLLYEGAVAESHLHQAPWPIKSARDICDILLS